MKQGNAVQVAVSHQPDVVSSLVRHDAVSLGQHFSTFRMFEMYSSMESISRSGISEMDAEEKGNAVTRTLENSGPVTLLHMLE